MNDFDFLNKDTFEADKYKDMVKSYYKEDKPTQWFDHIYESAKGDYTKVFWADLEPSPYLVSWLKENPINKPNKRACVIGCGVGDDAQALSEFGFEVIAFDISPKAIELCKNRYPNTKVKYIVADLFSYPKEVYLLGLFMAVLSTIIPSFMVSKSIKIIGSSNFSIIASIGPISTIVLAFIFLGEKLSIYQVLGTIIVISGILLVSKSKK